MREGKKMIPTPRTAAEWACAHCGHNVQPFSKDASLPGFLCWPCADAHAAHQAVVRALEAAINRIECRHETRGLLPCAACCEALYVARSDPAVQAALDALVAARTEGRENG